MIIRTPLSLSLACLLAAPVFAQTFDFSSSEQYTENFHQTFMQTGNPTGTLAVNSTSGRLVHNASGGSTTAWVYDTTPDTTATNTFSDFSLSLDFSIAAGSGSIGVYFGGISRTNSALALFNINNSGANDQLRIFSSGAEMTSATAGSNVAFSQVPTTTGYTSGAFYRLDLSVSYQTSSSALVTFTISDPSNTLTPISISGIVTGLAAEGEIGFRSYTGGPGSNMFDNLVIIPEPGTYVAVAGAAALGLAALRRRRR